MRIGKRDICPPDVQAVLDAYCKGVNQAVRAMGTPFEFKLMGYRPDDWTPADALLMVKLIGFVGLSQMQGDMEKLIVQLIQKGVDTERLKALFPAIRDDVSEEYIDLIKKVRLVRPMIPGFCCVARFVARFSASNNWAVRPSKTASGWGMMCGDPHLQLQLPSVWYLAVLSGDR